MNEFDIDKILEEISEPKLLFTRPELLICPNVPKPLHGVNPRTIMGTKKWNEKRREAYAKNNYHCWACGSYHAYDEQHLRFHDTKMDAHEFYSVNYELKTIELIEIVSLCKTCHGYIHNGRLNGLFDKGEVDEQACWEIYTHGDSLLIDAGYPPYNYVDEKTYEDEWMDWRLIIGYYEHEPKLKSYKEWREKYVK